MKKEEQTFENFKIIKQEKLDDYGKPKRTKRRIKKDKRK